MSANRTTSFLDSLQQYKIVSEAQADEIAHTLQQRFADVRTLAQELVRRGYLTAFQASEIFEGRGQGLLMGPYCVLDRLGEGGMGKVFKARHIHMDRIVALKVIPSECLDNPEAVARFYREVRAVAQLSHANIVTAYEVNQEAETHYGKSTRLTKLGNVLGTVDYISPEQAGDARDVDIRSDNYGHWPTMWLGVGWSNWIMIDVGQTYRISALKVWPYNESGGPRCRHLQIRGHHDRRQPQRLDFYPPQDHVG